MPELQKLNLSNNPVPVQPAMSVETRSMPSTKSFNLFVPLLLLVALFLGVGTGYAAFRKVKQPTGQVATLGTQIPAGNALKVGDVFGSADEKSFPDNAEGVLEKGGLNGEGSHHLVRPGGKSQTVYLTSSVIDLDQVVGHKVKVWGQTFSARKVGWLMDVGRVQIEELNVPVPSDQ